MAFDRQPTLQGPKLGLRPLRASDREAFLAVANDPLIWEEHPESDRATPEKLERFFADALASGGALVVTTADDEVVGSSRFEEPDEARDRILIDHTFLARTRYAVEEFLGAAHVDTVPTPLGDHAVYELSRDAWVQRVDATSPSPS